MAITLEKAFGKYADHHKNCWHFTKHSGCNCGFYDAQGEIWQGNYSYEVMQNLTRNHLRTFGRHIEGCHGIGAYCACGLTQILSGAVK
jgi:hypothetical protein